MTSDEINAAISEVCGVPMGTRLCCGGSYDLAIPNYSHSLDAMATAEAILNDDELDRYVRELVFLMKTGEARIFMSPPGRRAQAFLRTKGLWREDDKG